MEKQRPHYNFKDFMFQIRRKDIKRIVPARETAYYNTWWHNDKQILQDDFTLDEIESIIRSGDLQAYRELSMYYAC